MLLIGRDRPDPYLLEMKNRRRVWQQLPHLSSGKSDSYQAAFSGGQWFHELQIATWI